MKTYSLLRGNCSEEVINDSRPSADGYVHVICLGTEPVEIILGFHEYCSDSFFAFFCSGTAFKFDSSIRLRSGDSHRERKMTVLVLRAHDFDALMLLHCCAHQDYHRAKALKYGDCVEDLVSVAPVAFPFWKGMLYAFFEEISNPRSAACVCVESKQLQMAWRDSKKKIDCGVFLMRHMESYVGQRVAEWECGLVKGDTTTLHKLRLRYMKEFVISEHNEAPVVETVTPQSQQPLPPPVPKKRKDVETRSPCWDHFEKIKDSEGIVVKEKCIYCAKVYCCETKKHGTSSLRTHIVNCLKNPHSKETWQSLLTFRPTPSSAGTQSSEGTEGVLVTWVFDQDLIRRALAEMIILDELPFRIVEEQGFRKFVLVCCPRFKISSRWTISRDIFKIFSDERVNLKKFFRTSSQRVSITTDTWTSVQRINYMCITAHFIDSEWKLQKKIISFVLIYSHKGEIIAKALESCLLDWGLKSVFSVTVDNASSNDTALGFLKKKLVSWGCTAVRCKYLHMRCIAHILNLVVQDGLKECDSSVKKVRDAVRYVRSSPARLQKFKSLSDLIGVEAKNSLCLDVPTRWNSTYMMLNTALLFQKVFEAYDDHDSSFKSNFCGSVPDFLDWESIQSLVMILKSFYKKTVRISGSLYVTSNTFFSEIFDLSCLLKNMEEATEDNVKLMSKNMRAKFDKYWDPRDKIEYMPIQFKQLYGEDKGKTMFDKVIVGLKELFEDYVACFPVQSVEQSDKSSPSITISKSVSVGRPQSLLKSQIKKQKLVSGDLSWKKTELEVYLSEVIVDEDDSFELLRWWKQQSERFHVLSKMARDILAVPISTVASESAFSTSGRVLDAFRSSLTPRIVEALVCA
ncbi:PREDICTED: zinc finger BED domain-containing protein RICESLEEPER 2-like [Ipomoea nil]|uniref:zinc finger BED domain-containing protein RICESLEEPER 2-like n=1 Tax=Ipomoea nil TaxID=35883 RepID=UPI000900C768|nr:PREDICTED: zinc finger BED domain-containing protein RICESLEEPER 2-like [Ipomoea nil]